MRTTPHAYPPSPWNDRFLIAAFCVGISLPLLDNLLDLDTTPQRQPAQPPAWSELLAAPDSPTAWTEHAKQVFAERLGFRNRLIKVHGAAKVFGLGVSADDEVALGEDGWLYLEGDTMDQHRRLRPMNDALLAGVIEIFRNSQHWLAARDIHYIVIPVPNKATVYPEHTPARYSAPATGPSRMDRLVDALETRTSIDVIDLRPIFEDRRAEGMPLYHRLDSHWNTLGAYVAYRAILGRLQQRHVLSKAQPLERYEVTHEAREGDLARMLGLREMTELAPRLTPRFQRQARIEGTGESTTHYAPKYLAPFRTRTKGASAPHAVVMRDSFGDALVPYLSEHFAHTTYIWHDSIDVLRGASRFVERANPDVVVHLFAERVLARVVASSSGRRSDDLPQRASGIGGAMGSPKKKSTR